MQNNNNRVKRKKNIYNKGYLAYLDLPYRIWDFNIQSEMLAPVMSYIVSPDATCEILHSYWKLFQDKLINYFYMVLT